MTEKALRGVRPWNLLPSCSLLLVFRNPLSLVKPGPNETSGTKQKNRSSVIRPGLPCLRRINYFALGFCNYSPLHSKSFRQELCPLDRLHNNNNNNKAQQRRLPVAASWNGLEVSSCLCLFSSSFCLSVSHSQTTDPSWVLQPEHTIGKQKKPNLLQKRPKKVPRATIKTSKVA